MGKRILCEQVGKAVFLSREYHPKQQKLKGAKRGEVKGFSWASNKRFCEFMVRIDHEKTIEKFGGASWITLTFDGRETGAPNAKQHLDYLLSKVLPRAGYYGPAIWKAELQKRGTIHFHILLYSECTEDLKDFVNQKWHRITGSKQDAHLENGTDCVPVDSVARLRAYMAKYLTKEIGSSKEWNLGRIWGVRFSKELIKHEVEEKVIEMPFDTTDIRLDACKITLPRAIYNVDEYFEYVADMFEISACYRISYWKWRKAQAALRKEAIRIAKSREKFQLSLKVPQNQSVL